MSKTRILGCFSSLLEEKTKTEHSRVSPNPGLAYGGGHGLCRVLLCLWLFLSYQCYVADVGLSDCDFLSFS